MRQFGFVKFAVTNFFAVLLCAALIACTGQASSVPEVRIQEVASNDANTVVLADLPKQGRETWDLIHQGGSFPFEKDGAAFGNRERILPAKQRGFYREYTVKTPGEHSRGARRIICGGSEPQTPEICYYTSDHYASFRQIIP